MDDDDRPNLDECESCGADIYWVRLQRDDGELSKWVPVSVDSRERRIVLTDDQLGTQVPTFVSHFADCPDADSHRRGDSEQEDEG